MTQPTDESLEDTFARLLAEHDERLQSHGAPTDLADTPVSLHGRLQEAADFLGLLQRVWRGPAPTLSTSAAHSIRRTIGRFQVERILGSGGAGIVYLAHDPVLGRAVAVKVPRVEVLLTPALRQRFLREARTAALLNHPNIIPILEVGDAGELCFIVYAYCAGPALAEWLNQRQNQYGAEKQPISCAAAARLIEQLAEAIAHAHQRGILHRDLKPGNVLLDFRVANADPGNGEVDIGKAVPLITDFGLAKVIAETDEATQTGTLLGTPAYMAPEQTRNAKALGPACDIWALGVILYELLMGERPFRGDTSLEVMAQIRDREALPLRRRRHDVPRDLEKICLKCLEKEPHRRYVSAFALREDLQRFREGRPVAARPTPWWERLWKWTRRRPAAAALILVVITSMIAGIVGTAFYIARLQDLVAAGGREKAALERDKTQQRRIAEQEGRVRRLRYVGDIRAAAHALQERNPVAALPILQSCALLASDAERGLEWFELMRQARNQRLPQWLFKQERPLRSQVFALSSDASLAAWTHTRTEVHVYEMSTWKRRQVLQTYASQSLAFSPDGRLLAAVLTAERGKSTPQRAVLLCDWQTGTALGRSAWRPYSAGSRFELTFSPSGEMLLVHVDTELFILSVPEFPKEIARYSGGRVRCAALAPDGNTVVIAHADGGSVCFADFPSLQKKDAMLWTANHEWLDFRFSPDSSTLAASDGKHLEAIALPDMRLLVSHDLTADNVRDMCFSGDGTILFVAFTSDTVEAIDLDNKKWLIKQSAAGVQRFLPTADRKTLFMINRNGDLASMDACWPTLPQSIDARSGRIYALGFSPGGSLLASAGEGFGVHVWDPESGRRRAHLLCLSNLFAVTFAPDGKTVVAGGLDGLVHRWEVGTWNALPPLKGHTGRVARLAFTPDGQHLLSMGWDKTCRLWNWPEGELVHVFDGPFDHFSDAGLAPDGARFAWVGDDPSVRLWDLHAREERVLTSLPKSRAVCFTPDGQGFVTSEANGRMHLWDAHKGEFRRMVHGHERGVRAMAFSPDGKVLASAGLDKTVKIWDATSFLEMASFEGPTDELRALAWSPDGETLAAAGHDGRIWLWRRR